MDKRIAICLIAALLMLVVTAAYAPNPGSDTKEAGEQPAKATLQQVLDNQDKILGQLETLKQNQAQIQKDVRFIRSKTH